jgi:L-serine dehydratase
MKESISIFDIFKTGIGPSSSHTMGPWRAAQRFVRFCESAGHVPEPDSVKVELFGSLAKTGIGHGTDVALVMGLNNCNPETCSTQDVDGYVKTRKELASQISFNREKYLPYHPNGMVFTVKLPNGSVLSKTYYSVGGGFVVEESETLDSNRTLTLPYPIVQARDLVAICCATGLSIPQVVYKNEQAWRNSGEIEGRILEVYNTMAAAIHRGCTTEGVLPGGLNVSRRAKRIAENMLESQVPDSMEKFMKAIRRKGESFDNVLRWVTCFALAVNEENAAFGRVVTAPTNGSAGVVPAVLMYLVLFRGGDMSDVRDFLLTAGEIGSIFKKGATISAAMGGCQAEIGVSSAMAAAGLTQCVGGSYEQVLMAAEIAMEHHLGLTCDPVAGLVQIPCIERNTMGAVKAITASSIAMESNPSQAKVSLDDVVKTMWETAKDMNNRYKETSDGGLAAQIPVVLPDC